MAIWYNENELLEVLLDFTWVIFVLESNKSI